jgi:hypothetical protein
MVAARRQPVYMLESAGLLTGLPLMPMSGRGADLADGGVDGTIRNYLQIPNRGQGDDPAH